MAMVWNRMAWSRAGGIRTRDLFDPNEARYQAVLQPDDTSDGTDMEPIIRNWIHVHVSDTTDSKAPRGGLEPPT